MAMEFLRPHEKRRQGMRVGVRAGRSLPGHPHLNRRYFRPVNDDGVFARLEVTVFKMSAKVLGVMAAALIAVLPMAGTTAAAASVRPTASAIHETDIVINLSGK